MYPSQSIVSELERLASLHMDQFVAAQVTKAPFTLFYIPLLSCLFCHCFAPSRSLGLVIKKSMESEQGYVG